MAIVFVILALVLGVRAGRVPVEPQWSTIENHEMYGENKGDWGNVDLCTTLSFATAVSIKHDGVTHNSYVDELQKQERTSDDLAATGLKFHCASETGYDSGYVESSSVSQGYWLAEQSCPDNQLIIGMALNTKRESLTKHLDDDLGVEDVRILCQDGTTIDALSGQVGKMSESEMLKLQERASRVSQDLPKTGGIVQAVPLTPMAGPNGRIYAGYWGPMYTCSAYTYMCGIQNRVDPTDALDDNAGLTDVIFYCCN